MDNRNEKNDTERFTYTYSARQQEELKRIRRKYLPPEEDKMERLKRLDRNASAKGTVVALILGILGMLLFGGGMSCTILWPGTLIIPGVAMGIVGIVLISLANPAYQHITKKEREKIAPEILRLTDELLK